MCDSGDTDDMDKWQEIEPTPLCREIESARKDLNVKCSRPICWPLLYVYSERCSLIPSKW